MATLQSSLPQKALSRVWQTLISGSKTKFDGQCCKRTFRTPFLTDLSIKKFVKKIPAGMVYCLHTYNSPLDKHQVKLGNIHWVTGNEKCSVVSSNVSAEMTFRLCASYKTELRCGLNSFISSKSF